MTFTTTCASPEVQLSSLPADETLLRLPHPYLTEYTVQRAASSPLLQGHANAPLYQLSERAGSSKQPTPSRLDSADVFFSEPVSLGSAALPPASNNSPWARARRSPGCVWVWHSVEPPSPAQAWLLIYVLFTVRPATESVRLQLRGRGAALLAQQLIDLVLAVQNPPKASDGTGEALLASRTDEAVVLALRSAFWQGAGSPFGPRPVWLPQASPPSLQQTSSPVSSYPAAPMHHTMTVAPAGDPHDPGRRQQSRHPIRPAKPGPGSVIYSRWVYHLKETFSMVVVDWQDPEHLRLVHEWMNEPRVIRGWDEAGTLEHHRQYLRAIHQDPHQMAVLGRWDDTFFGYFELYWAKEDRLGGYCEVGDFDRGRHSLVGDARFRGPHRVSGWASGQLHYLFLDDPRTMNVFSEPRVTNSTSVVYDLSHGCSVDHFIDFPHKRSSVDRCPRLRFFQLCPMAEQEKAVCGLSVTLSPKP
ncbi:hypothetical protein CDD83_9204 [Cordyceps sp. RAO-2017]|nr:hypothetical protein CDD83_9204 [Cordyceps sp. RAO-2017]